MQPVGITSDGTNLFVTNNGNGRSINKVVIATGAISTLGGNATFDWLDDIATDGVNLFLPNGVIKKMEIASGRITILAGSGTSGSADGIGPMATFCNPSDVTTDGKNLFVADSFNNTIRKIHIATGAVTTLAGTPGINGSVDAKGAAASFSHPKSITTDGTNVYVSDSGGDNYKTTVRKIIIATGDVTTLAGTPGINGSVDGTGATARFGSINGITTDGTNVYVTDSNNSTIRKIVISTGAVTTLAGTAGKSGFADGIGAEARFSSPYGITTDGTYLYVTDYSVSDGNLRKIEIATGAVTTIMKIGYHNSLTTDGMNLFVTSLMPATISKYDLATGVVTTLAGPGIFYSDMSVGPVDGTGTAAMFGYPQGITSDGTSLYVADGSYNTIRKIQ